ncbi:MAG: ankyrin repeat domain-containing protein [Treponema sp.]|nr:ankyrin repeat domain-containing protein [Treponema sp.]
MNKKTLSVLAVLLIFLSKAVSADDYRWSLIEALTKNDMETTENIIKANITSMTAAEKMLVMNFAINYSAGENTIKACELLLKYNIYPNAYDLYTAINRNRQNNAIQLLMQNGASPNGEILLLAMERQRFDLAKQFIETGVDVNYRYPQSSNNTDSMTPLLHAVKWENFEMVKLLLEHGADINQNAFNGDTVLSIAKKTGNNDIYGYLLEHGAAETINITQGHNTGIANMMDNSVISFQAGSYRLSGNTKYMRFTGTSGSGSVNYVDILNNRSTNGFYRITGNNMTVTMNGYTFMYRIDSNESFSGSGEIWTRSGN